MIQELERRRKMGRDEVK